jgi:uncharacterized protein (TIGR02231 family)
MKRIFIVLSILFLAILRLPAQEEKEIKAGIKHVTVFPDRAQIEQETPVSLMPGNTILKLSGLSPYIDVQSILVKGYGEFTILSVNLRNNYLLDLEDSPEVKNIRSQIGSLKLKVEDEKAALGVLKEKEAFLVANRGIMIKEATFTIEQLKSLMELYTNNMEQISIASLTKQRRIQDYEKQIAALEKQIADRLGKPQLPTGEIYVTLSSARQTAGRLTFSYVVSNSGWYPSYDIRVDDIKNPVGIYYKANVFQNTGVDWKDVKISFSNASPWIAGDIPVLYPWFIDYYIPAPNLAVTASGVRRQNAPVMMEKAAEDKAQELYREAAPVPVEKKSGETTVTFDIAVAVSIPSDGNLQTIEMQRLKVPAEYKYVTLPKLSPLAYLTANITDWAKLSLQSGEATLYFDNAFVGKSTINVNQLKDTLTLSLGTDNSILVKREKRVDFTSKKIIGSNKTETYSFLTTIRNNKSVPVKLTLNDQIPLSSNSGITVDPVELSGGRLDSQTGEVRWDLDIGQQETRQIVLTYSVKYPKDKIVILE